MQKWLAILFLFLPITAYCEPRHFSDWSESEKIEFSVFTLMAIIDYKQTDWALEQIDATGNFLYRESNPLYGSRPSDSELALGTLIGITGYYYLISISDSPKYHKIPMSVRKFALGIKFATVMHNNSVGITVKKVW